jgi:hypothetical protein
MISVSFSFVLDIAQELVIKTGKNVGKHLHRALDDNAPD